MKLIFFLIIGIILALGSSSKSNTKSKSQEKVIAKLEKQLAEKDDYIQLLETFIKKNLFTTEGSESFPLTNKATSFLQTQESLTEKTKAGPVLKAMLFGFPNPRSLTFGSQNTKGEGKNNYQNMKICERGCIVV